MVDASLNVRVERHVERAALGAKYRFNGRQLLQILNRRAETRLNLVLIETDYVKPIRVTQTRDTRLARRRRGSIYLRRDPRRPIMRRGPYHSYRLSTTRKAARRGQARKEIEAPPMDNPHDSAPTQ
jgi:hypothetical protein